MPDILPQFLVLGKQPSFMVLFVVSYANHLLFGYFILRHKKKVRTNFILF